MTGYRAGARLAAAMLVGTSAVALQLPQAGPGDPRIRWVRYDPNQVVALRGSLGFQFPIEFGDDERIENVSIGDSLGWQVTPNHRANALFLKPMLRHADTNMTVLTNQRRYSFALSVLPRGSKAGLFGLHFEYAVPAMAIPVAATAAPPQAPRDANHAYSYTGARGNVPDRLFDDGRFTYFGFGKATEYPAIFILDGKKESMATTSIRDNYVVVDQLARRFVLRRGDDVTTIVNDGYVEPVPGPLSPKPRKK